MNKSVTLPPFLMLEPQYRDYVWGGQRLRPEGGRTAEAWVVYEQNKVANGPCQGLTLAELAFQYGTALLGAKVYQKTGNRFPLLIKLLDVAQWLSIQVHPNDQQALEIEGQGHFGKTEAWHTLESTPGASIIAGVKEDITPEVLQQAIYDGTVDKVVRYLALQPGDTVLMHPGTLHSLGPGLLIYELQQNSDLTYRVYDWGRPLSENRILHIEQSLAVTRLDAHAEHFPPPEMRDGEERLLCKSDHFKLSLIKAVAQSISLNTNLETFHALTVIEGQARFQMGEDSMELMPFDTLLVPAFTGNYQLEPLGKCRVLKAFV